MSYRLRTDRITMLTTRSTCSSAHSLFRGYVQIEQVQQHGHVRVVLRVESSKRRQHRGHVQRRLHVRLDAFAQFAGIFLRSQSDD